MKRPYRIAYTSATAAGTHAPVLAGLAVTISAMSSWLPEGLRVVEPDEGLPKLPEAALFMLTSRAARQPVTDALARYIAEAFRTEPKRIERLAFAEPWG